MKRSFVYLSAVIALSLMLGGCGNMSGSGNVGTSPAPAIESPVIPSPDLDMPMMPEDSSRPDRNDRSMGGTGSATEGTGGDTIVSPSPSTKVK